MTAGTSRHPTSATSARRIKQGKASLVGGMAVGVAVFVLWIAVAHELAVDGALAIAAGALVAAGIAAWIRIADL